MSYEWLTLWGYVPEFLKAGWLTLQVTLLAFVLAVLLGLLTALASISPVAVFRYIARAYVEVFRAGIQSVPRGQLEAAGILGLERGQIFTEIVLPQAARAVYPAIVNYLIQLLLGTSLLSAIALPELTGTATVINSRTLLYVQTFAVVLVAYLVLSNVLSWIASQLGARMFHPPLIVRPRARFGGFALRRANRA
jgi:polar amino acid transport system permease protein